MGYRFPAQSTSPQPPSIPPSLVFVFIQPLFFTFSLLMKQQWMRCVGLSFLLRYSKDRAESKEENGIHLRNEWNVFFRGRGAVPAHNPQTIHSAPTPFINLSFPFNQRVAFISNIKFIHLIGLRWFVCSGMK